MACEGLLTCAECFEALKKLPNGKSPGNDGLTAEFYKTFGNLLEQQLTDSLNYSFEHDELSTSQEQAIIKLIDKKDRDRRYIRIGGQFLSLTWIRKLLQKPSLYA